MSVIDIREFGGEVPSTSPRALPGMTAQAAQNLNNSSNEFYPMDASLVLGTTESVINPGSAVPDPVSMFRTAFLPDGSPNNSLSAGWLISANETHLVRAQINNLAPEQAAIGAPVDITYYTDTSGPRKFAFQGGTLVDRPMGVPAPATAPTVSHVVIDEFRTSELDGAAKDSRTLIENMLFGQSVGGLDGSEFAFTPPTTTNFGWVDSLLPDFKLLRVPYIDGAIREGFEFLQNPNFGGSEVSALGVTYWQLNLFLFGRTWGVDPVALKAAFLALPDPAIVGGSLMTTDDADLAVAQAQAYYSPTESPQVEIIAQAVEKTNAIQRALQSVQDGSLKANFYSSAVYRNGLNTLIGDGTVQGTVTNAILDYVFISTANSAYGEPGNVPDEFITAPTRYWQPDFAEFGGYTAAEGRSLIRADLVANVKTRDDGTKWFDYGAMVEILVAEFDDIFSQRSVASQNHYRPLLAGWITEMLYPIKAFFEPDAQTVLSAGLVGGGTLTIAFQGLLTSATTDLQRISDHYNNLRNSVGTLAKAIYESPGISTRGTQQAAAVTPIIDTRFYIATYVTNWGEESAPSEVSEMVEVDQNDQVVVTIVPPVGRPDITKWRLYRSNVGSVSAAFQGLHEGFIAPQFVGDTPLVFLDTFASSELQEVCPTLTWLEPNDALRGLVGLPNGIMAGHFDNTVAFCEPFVPYAWPLEYELTVESTVVGLGVFGQTVFVGTTGSPYFISGADPASMSAIKLESSQACVSSRSIVALEGGVIYASPDGLCMADQSGVRLLTRELWSSKDWRALQPETIFASSHEGAYIFACNDGTRVYILGNGKLIEVTLDVLGVSALYNDKVSGTLCAAAGSFIVAPFRGTTQRTALWRSKLLTLPAQTPLAWVKVYGYQSVDAPATVRWYGDGVLKHTATFTDLEPQRLPPGRWLEHEVEVESKARLTRVTLASSLDELKAV